jgi:NADH:ubiquinone oxidoreductase subunit 5 (subunit L)/multisubunit Na+/H+ antiporter MnhA subunit
MLALASLRSRFLSLDQAVISLVKTRGLSGIALFLVLAAAGKSAQLGLHA